MAVAGIEAGKNPFVDLKRHSLGRFVPSPKGDLIINHFPDATSAQLIAAYRDTKEAIVKYLNILLSVASGLTKNTPSSQEFINDPKTRELINAGWLKVVTDAEPRTESAASTPRGKKVALTNRLYSDSDIFDLLAIATANGKPISVEDITNHDRYLLRLVNSLFAPVNPEFEDEKRLKRGEPLTYSLLRGAAVPRFGRTTSIPG